MTGKLLLVVPIVATVVSGCDQHGVQNVATLQTLEKRIDELTKKVAAQQAQLDGQKYTNEITNMTLQEIGDLPAYVDTSNKEFDVGRTQYGPFTASAEKIEPYLDGYKVTVRIGNLSAATLTGATLELGWGPYGMGHKQEFKVTKDFLQGRFTDYEVALTPAKPEDVKLLSVRAKFSGLKLMLPID